VRALRLLDENPRPKKRRVLAGVCAMIADRVGVDATWIRVAFVALALAKGIGVGLYLLLWLLLPARGDRLPTKSWKDAAHARLTGARDEVQERAGALGEAWSSLEENGPRRWVALGAIGLGALVLLASFGAFEWLTPIRGIGVALLLFGGGVLAAAGGSRR